MLLEQVVLLLRCKESCFVIELIHSLPYVILLVYDVIQVLDLYKSSFRRLHEQLAITLCVRTGRIKRNN